MLEVDPAPAGRYGVAPAFDEGRESGDVVGLDVRLEDGPDRRAESPCLLEYSSTSSACGSTTAS